jgi:hypothetical protein
LNPTYICWPSVKLGKSFSGRKREHRLLGGNGSFCGIPVVEAWPGNGSF